MRRSGDGPRRDIEDLCRLRLRQAQHVATDHDLALSFGQLAELHQQIDLAIPAHDLRRAPNRREGTKDPIPPAMAFPRSAGHHEEPSFRLRDGAALPERVLERILERVGGVLRTGAHRDKGADNLRVGGFAGQKPLRSGQSLRSLARQRHLHALKCRGWPESFSDRDDLLALVLRRRLPS